MVTIGEVRRILVEKVESGDYTPVILVGDVGVGKSTVFKLVAKDLGFGFFSMNVGYKDGWELKGYPQPDGDFAVYKPFKWMDVFSKDSVVVFDDVSNVRNLSVFDAIIEILDSSSFGNYSLENVLIGFTANLPEHSSLARLIPEPIEGRSEVYRIDRFDVGEWSRFMVEMYGSDWCQRVGLFLEKFPNFLYVHEGNVVVSPRSWSLLAVRLKRLGRIDERVVKGFIRIERVAKLFTDFSDVSVSLEDFDNWDNLSPVKRMILASLIVSLLNSGRVFPKITYLYEHDRESLFLIISQLDGRGKEMLMKSLGRKRFLELAKVSLELRGVGVD